jgi:hypothetical protein
MMMKFAVTATLVTFGILATTLPASAAVQTWRIDDATVTLSLDAAHLATLGLAVAGDRTTATSELPAGELIEGERHSYGLRSGAGVTFRTDDGAFVEFDGARTARLPFDGGLSFRATHPRTQAALPPALLYDFAVEIDPDAELNLVRLVGADPSLPVPLAARSSSIVFGWSTGELAIRRADLVITPAWAALLGQPELAEQWVGGLDLRVRATPVDGAAIAPAPAGAPGPDPRSAVLDVTLGQLYGITSMGRTGTYPNGRNGLSAATTSCNSGSVNVPWFAAMQENHPTIGLALFRLSAGGVLEMIGQNYMKHGFYALSNDQCNFGCQGGGNGTYLLVDCSDTYSSGHNGDRNHQGPRSEIDPVTGEWVACGSYFDDWNTPDGDCTRDYFGNEPNGVAHRVEVHDSDLGNPGALYYYEGEYVVRNDSRLDNSIGWRQCTAVWTGSSWAFQTVGGGLTPSYGPLVKTWGDEQVEKKLTEGDGSVILATKVDDLGGGQWHYEYALYNWWSERGVRSFSVPIGAAAVSNISFHDLDQDAGNNWSVDLSNGSITWSTDDYTTDPDAHALFFQTMFNFRFDASVAPEPGTVTLLPFKPGTGSVVYIDVQTPPAGATAVLAGAGAQDLALAAEPNPFRERTELRFAVAEGRAVRLAVVDVAGRVVRTLVDGEAPAGSNRVVWDGRSDEGERLASGVYFFRLDAGMQSRTLKATLLR